MGPPMPPPRGYSFGPREGPTIPKPKVGKSRPATTSLLDTKFLELLTTDEKHVLDEIDAFLSPEVPKPRANHGKDKLPALHASESAPVLHRVKLTDALDRASSPSSPV